MTVERSDWQLCCHTELQFSEIIPKTEGFNIARKNDKEAKLMLAWKNGIRFLLENSLFLIGGTIVALVFANAGYDIYHHTVHAELFPHINLHFIVNDVLMCFFFALAAKEIWEAILPGGDLHGIKKAATPLIATTGGVIGPAVLYLLGAFLFKAHALYRGWAIPCATDIAFSYLVARLIFGKGHPAIPFLLLLAIADDAAGLIILAIAYPQKSLDLITFFACVIGAIGFNLFVLRKLMDAKNFWLYLLVAAPLSWYGFFKGGIHPALALVPIIPTLPHAEKDVGFFEGARPDHPTDPLNMFEYWWKNPVELILCLFGFANAGVMFSVIGLSTGLVSVGLLAGKPIGIFLFTTVGIKLLKLELPEGMTFRDLVVLGFMAGIGFTVALFVATVAFPAKDYPAILDASKMGALFSFGASILSLLTAFFLRVGKFSRQKQKAGKLTPQTQTH